MGTFGERLRRERELRGVSLDEIAVATKIGTRLLRALEDEQFDLLPGGIFNKGFIRAYAKYLGIDEEAAVADYLNSAGHGDPDLRVVAAQSASEYSSRSEVAAPPRRASFPFVPVLILIVIVAAASGAWRIYQDRQREAEAKHAATQPASPAITTTGSTSSPDRTGSTAPITSGTGPAIPPPARSGEHTAAVGRDLSAKPTTPLAKTAVQSGDAGLASREPAAPSSAAPAGNLIASAKPLDATGPPFEVVVKAKDRAWVSIKSDGKIMVRGIIKPPDIKTVHATDQVVFWTGNAGDVEVSFNGREVPLSGGQNQEQVLVFNSHGLLPQAPH